MDALNTDVDADIDGNADVLPRAVAAEASPAPGPALALVEVLDRDGQARQAHTVRRWPLRIGRALDNDLVLAEPHAAAHHLVIGPAVTEGADGGDSSDRSALALTAGDTRNGVRVPGRRLRGGERAVLAVTGEPIELGVGRTTLRLRLPGHTLAPEQLLAPVATLARRALPLAAVALVLLFGTLFSTYLFTDPDGFARAAGNAVLTAGVLGAGWCSVWALLSKTFTHQARFGWHLRVFLVAGLTLLLATNLPPLLAFAFSWPALSAFDFVGSIVVAAAAFYFHLLAVEPARPRALKWAAVACGAVALGLTLWFNQQRGDRFGDELYMSHLFPPALRLAQPVPLEDFVRGLAPLQATLEQKAREPARGDDPE